MRAVVFDMDGTLLDSVPTVSRAYADAIHSLGGPPVTPDEVVAGWHVGHTELVLAHFLGRACGPAEVERFHAHLDPAIAGLRPFPGIPALLDDLAGAGLRLGVFTAATRRVAASMLAAAGLGMRFEVVVAGDEVDRPKPAPDGLLLAGRRLGVPAGATAYAGDAAVDLGCAHAAGAQGVHAAWGARTGVGAGAHLVAVRPHDLVPLPAPPGRHTPGPVTATG
ncbi:HAD family hydrolase [Streptomyces sp. CMB-StM0423]|uniref:HAD family hydrolase n=1 Tax=Streptomyces sp. CMB-StM0423 TaxID=2059884 RepID=UPI000C70192F|nr:HAD family hydrolase [Streptomyces sp. CMB-StM0423]AUH39450.1 HAD family hydrolase [Streptomyces sp. CMB-StM0423]